MRKPFSRQPHWLRKLRNATNTHLHTAHCGNRRAFVCYRFSVIPVRHTILTTKHGVNLCHAGGGATNNRRARVPFCCTVHDCSIMISTIVCRCATSCFQSELTTRLRGTARCTPYTNRKGFSKPIVTRGISSTQMNTGQNGRGKTFYETHTQRGRPSPGSYQMAPDRRPNIASSITAATQFPFIRVINTTAEL